jgi:hypothetical protein
VEREVKRRIDITAYMRKIGVGNYMDVSRIISAYYKDPDRVTKRAREELKKDAAPPGGAAVRKTA